MDINIKYLRALMVFVSLPAGFARADDPWALADARVDAMGKNPALEAGFYALNINPALLVTVPSLQFGFTHKDFPSPATTAEIVGGVLPLGAYGAVAGAYGTVRVDGVEMWTDLNELLGDYLYHDDRVSAGYGLNVFDWLAAGATFNYDRHLTGAPPVDYNNLLPETNHKSYTTYGAGAGLYVRTPEVAGGPLSLGVGGQNLFASTRKTSYGDYREPVAVYGGAAWARYFGNHRMTVAAGGPLVEPTAVALTGEFSISSMFAARGGATATRTAVGDIDARPTVGGGVDYSWFSFDYCYLARALGAFQYFSFSLNPGRRSRTEEQRRAQAKRWLAEAKAFYDAGAYERAAGRYADVLKIDPSNAEAREYLPKSQYYVYLTGGVAYLQNAQWDKAREAFNEALQLNPGDFLAAEYLGVTDQREAEELARLAEEQRIAEKYAAAEKAVRNEAYRQAITLCQDILTAYPDHEAAATLLARARRLYAESLAAANITAPPEELVKPSEIPPEAVTRYRNGAALMARGALNESIATLGGVVSEYPTYGAARAKLVDALLLQGLDYYSKGSISSALQVWRRARTLDPGNEKAARYVAKAEGEVR